MKNKALNGSMKRVYKVHDIWNTLYRGHREEGVGEGGGGYRPPIFSFLDYTSLLNIAPPPHFFPY